MTHEMVKAKKRLRPQVAPAGPVRGGFTLLELIMVLLILAIAVALVAPSMGNFARSHQSLETADQLVTLTRFAHTQAASEGTIYRLNLDLRARRFWLSIQDSSGDHPLATSSGQMFDLPQGVDMQCDIAPDPAGKGRIVIHFYPNGRTEPGTIRLANGRSTIQVSCPSASEPFDIVPERGGA